MIAGRYLLVTQIPCHVCEDGRRTVDALWHKDLMEHLSYIRDLVVAAPRASEPLPETSWPRQVAGPPAGPGFLDLSRPRSLLGALRALPGDLARLWRGIGEAEIVHVGVVGWPIPLGWFATAMARLRGRFLVLVVESSPWRVVPGRPAKLHHRLREVISEWAARRCARAADAPFFTQARYRDELLGPGSGRGIILPASWIDDRVILSADEADSLWRARLDPAGSPGLRLVYAGRLAAEKGVGVMLEALQAVDADEGGPPVRLDILGRGPMEADCRRVAGGLAGRASARLLGTLPYDESFFRALNPYHAAVVPGLGDEQPRIVFDAFSRALPVLGSDTPGLRGCVADGSDGLLSAAGDAGALADLIRRAAADREALRGLGLAALGSARRLTHREMHRVRRRALIDLLEARKGRRRGGSAAAGADPVG